MTDLRQAASSNIADASSLDGQVQKMGAPLSDLYNELLFAVNKKTPNETRHQTALRYIQQAEAASEAHNIGGDK